jgi:hypothetical protein
VHALKPCILAHRFKKLTVSSDCASRPTARKTERLSRAAICDLESQTLVEACRSATSPMRTASLLRLSGTGVGDGESVRRIRRYSVTSALLSAVQRIVTPRGSTRLTVFAGSCIPCDCHRSCVRSDPRSIRIPPDLTQRVAPGQRLSGVPPRQQCFAGWIMAARRHTISR